MARLYKDHFGQYHLTDLGGDIAQAKRNAQFHQDMARIEANASDGIANAVSTGVAGSAGLVIGAGALTYAMVKDKKIRYAVQVIIHLVVTWFLVYAIVFASGIPGADTDSAGNDEWTALFIRSWAIASIASLIWTGVYIRLRTVPKWRRLNELTRETRY